jgi:hypothetical protein
MLQFDELLGRAEVPGQLERLRVEVVLELGERVGQGAGPAPDPLLAVADDRDGRAFARQHRLQERVLGVGGVLELVGEHVRVGRGECALQLRA